MIITPAEKNKGLKLVIKQLLFDGKISDEDISELQNEYWGTDKDFLGDYLQELMDEYNIELQESVEH